MSELPTNLTDKAVVDAIVAAGRDSVLREALLDVLRKAELASEEPRRFRENVRWPLVLTLLKEAGTHRIALKDGLVFEVGLSSRIDQAVLLSREQHPDHVWEPQTTRLLLALADGASNVIVGGAYIGDQVLPIARKLAADSPSGTVHAFEPYKPSFSRLLRNVELNAIKNIKIINMCLSNKDGLAFGLTEVADHATAVALETSADGPSDGVRSITIDSYVRQNALGRVGLIMLDIEGGEEKAIQGASETISRPWPECPHLVFEVHRHYVDWSAGLEKTRIITFLTSLGYQVYAVRDFHDNYAMNGRPIEIIPVDQVYLEGPPHGFNLMATKDQELPGRLGLKVVPNVSPKLLLEKDPSLHHPVGGL